MRSLNSSVFKWPNSAEVDHGFLVWGEREALRRPELVRLGYYGSYARGDWGVGSDLDIIAIVSASDKDWRDRPLEWELLSLPVPAHIVVYTEKEWALMLREGRLFALAVEREAAWRFPKNET